MPFPGIRRRWNTLIGQISSNVFIVSASGGQKPQLWANFDLLGAPVPTPFTDEDQVWRAIADPRHTLTCQISSRSVYSIALCWRKKNNFLPFTSAFIGVVNWQQFEKVITQVHNYKPSPIQRHQNSCFCTPTRSWQNRTHNL